MDFKLSKLRSEAKKFSYVNDRARVRFLALIELCKRCDQNPKRLKEVDYEAVGARFRHSGRSVQRWFKLYESRGAPGLIAKKAPGRRPSPVRGHTAKLICDYVGRYGWGSELLHVHLKHDHDIHLGVHRIRAYLRKKGLLKKRRLKAALKKRHTRKVVVTIPGAHTQMDVKYFPRSSTREKQYYVYNFRDHATRWTYKRAYESLGAAETVDFFRRVLARFPGRIWCVQTDNGSEFTNFYLSHVDRPKTHALDLVCREQGVRHKLIPPGEKELQGLVERSHREDEQELYHRLRPASAEEINLHLEPHCHWLNHRRRKRGIGWRTSEEYLAHYRENPQLFQQDLAIVQRKHQPWRDQQIQQPQQPTESSA
jgi:transposase InsO family protein